MAVADPLGALSTSKSPVAATASTESPVQYAPPPWRPSAVFEHLPPLPYRKLSAGEVKPNVEGLHVLARQGSWRACVERAREILATSTNASTDWLPVAAYHVLALTKLKSYGAASDELRKLGRGGLGGAVYI